MSKAFYWLLFIQGFWLNDDLFGQTRTIRIPEVGTPFIDVYLPEQYGAHSQNFEDPIQTWNFADGLSNPIIRNIVQDNRGFLWLGTEHGLNRFDGLQFTNFYHRPDDVNSLSNNLIYGLDVDKNGNIWIGTELGLNKMDPYSFKVERFYTETNQPKSLSSNQIRYVLVDSKNRIWVGTQDGLNYLEHSSTGFRRIIDDRIFEEPLSLKYSYNRINTIFEDSKGRIWVGIDGGGIKIVDANLEDELILKIPGGDEITRQIIRVIYEDDAGHYWVGTDLGLAQFSSKLEYLKFYGEQASTDSLSNQYVWGIVERDDLLWVSTYHGGINILDPKKQRFIGHIRNDRQDARTLTSDHIWPMIKDEEGDIWVGTDENGGLNYFKPEGKKFEHKLSQADFGVDFNIQDIHEWGDSTVLFSTRESIYKHYHSHKTKPGELLLDQSLGARFVQYNNEILVVTGNKIVFFNRALEKLKELTIENLPRKTTITTVAIDDQGNLYVGTLGEGLRYINLESGHQTSFFETGNSSFYLDRRTIQDIWIESKEVIYVASVKNGLIRLNPQTGALDQFLFHTDRFFEPTINTICGGADNTLWLGTTSNGLIRFDKKTGTSQTFYSRESMLTNEITALILEENDRFLWLASKNGLGKFDLQTERFLSFNLEDGLQSKIFNTAYHKGESGKFYFGGVNGYNSFVPQKIEFNQSKPIVYLETLSLSDTTYYLREHPVSFGYASMELSYDQNNINLTFSTPSYLHANRVTYAYKTSTDEEWSTLGKERNVRLANLSPGDYTIQVRAANNDGLWGKPSLLNLSITPPWWESLGFQFFMALVMIFGFFGLYHYRLRSIKRQRALLAKQVEERTQALNEQKDKAVEDKKTIEQQAAELQKLDKAKSQFFTNITHELKTPLTLINAPIIDLLNRSGRDMPEEDKKKLELVRNSGQNLGTLVEELLDLAKLEAGKLEAINNPISLHESFELLTDDFKALADQRSIQFKIINDIPETLATMSDETKMHKVLNNLLSNAFKFTPPAGHIVASATIDKNSNRVIFSVSDTGPGIHPDEHDKIFDRYYQSIHDQNKAMGGTGIGLAYAKELANLLGGELKLQSQLGKGSEFIFSMKLATTTLSRPDMDQVPLDEEIMENFEEAVRSYSLAIKSDRPSVLMVEDHPDMRFYVGDLLKEYFTVVEAENGQVALDLLDGRSFDIIISDVMMPLVDGMELIAQVKAHETWRNMSMIMLTARSAVEDKVYALNLGVDDYLTKPFDRSELIARLKNILVNRTNRLTAYNDEDEELISVDQQLVQAIERHVKVYIQDKRLSVSFLSEKMSISERQLQRKLKQVSGLSPLQLIREVRLNHARELLEARVKSTVAEVAYACGFDSAPTFSSQFISRFGKRPSSYL